MFLIVDPIAEIQFVLWITVETGFVRNLRKQLEIAHWIAMFVVIEFVLHQKLL